MVLNIDPVWDLWAYRSGDLKLIKGVWSNGQYDGWYPTVEASKFERSVRCRGKGRACDGKHGYCLFNITDDPCEENDLSPDMPEKVQVGNDSDGHCSAVRTFPH